MLNQRQQGLVDGLVEAMEEINGVNPNRISIIDVQSLLSEIKDEEMQLSEIEAYNRATMEEVKSFMLRLFNTVKNDLHFLGFPSALSEDEGYGYYISVRQPGKEDYGLFSIYPSIDRKPFQNKRGGITKRTFKGKVFMNGGAALTPEDFFESSKFINTIKENAKI